MSSTEKSSQAPEVNRIQRWFQAVVTHPDGVNAGLDSKEAQHLMGLRPDELERVVTRSRALSAAERMAIYANAYHTRLLECLGDVYPMLKRTMGDEAFGGFAFGYLQTYPSRSYTLNELGRRFADYLQETRPASERENSATEGKRLSGDWPDFLIDLARLEWAIYEVFDGPGTEGRELLRAEDLHKIHPEQWPATRLAPVPCLRLLSTRFPVNDYFTARRQAPESDTVSMPSAQPSFVALTRRDFVVRRYALEATEFAILKTLQQGGTIGEAIEGAAMGSEIQLEMLTSCIRDWFRKWTREGFFQSVQPS